MKRKKAGRDRIRPHLSRGHSRPSKRMRRTPGMDPSRFVFTVPLPSCVLHHEGVPLRRRQRRGRIRVRGTVFGPLSSPTSKSSIGSNVIWPESHPFRIYITKLLNLFFSNRSLRAAASRNKDLRRDVEYKLRKIVRPNLVSLCQTLYSFPLEALVSSLKDFLRPLCLNFVRSCLDDPDLPSSPLLPPQQAQWDPNSWDTFRHPLDRFHSLWETCVKEGVVSHLRHTLDSSNSTPDLPRLLLHHVFRLWKTNSVETGPNVIHDVLGDLMFGEEGPITARGELFSNDGLLSNTEAVVGQRLGRALMRMIRNLRCRHRDGLPLPESSMDAVQRVIEICDDDLGVIERINHRIVLEAENWWGEEVWKQLRMDDSQGRWKRLFDVLGLLLPQEFGFHEQCSFSLSCHSTIFNDVISGKVIWRIVTFLGQRLWEEIDDEETSRVRSRLVQEFLFADQKVRSMQEDVFQMFEQVVQNNFIPILNTEVDEEGKAMQTEAEKELEAAMAFSKKVLEFWAMVKRIVASMFSADVSPSPPFIAQSFHDRAMRVVWRCLSEESSTSNHDDEDRMQVDREPGGANDEDRMDIDEVGSGDEPYDESKTVLNRRMKKLILGFKRPDLDENWLDFVNAFLLCLDPIVARPKVKGTILGQLLEVCIHRRWKLFAYQDLPPQIRGGTTEMEQDETFLERLLQRVGISTSRFAWILDKDNGLFSRNVTCCVRCSSDGAAVSVDLPYIDLFLSRFTVRQPSLTAFAHAIRGDSDSDFSRSVSDPFLSLYLIDGTLIKEINHSAASPLVSGSLTFPLEAYPPSLSGISSRAHQAFVSLPSPFKVEEETPRQLVKEVMWCPSLGICHLDGWFHVRSGSTIRGGEEFEVVKFELIVSEIQAVVLLKCFNGGAAGNGAVTLEAICDLFPTLIDMPKKVTVWRHLRRLTQRKLVRMKRSATGKVLVQLNSGVFSTKGPTQRRTINLLPRAE